MRVAAGLAYSTRPSAVSTAMMSAAFSTSASNRESVTRSPLLMPRISVRSRATRDTASISPRRSRWATMTANTNMELSSPVRNVRMPRQRPYFTRAGSTLTS